MTTRYFIRTLRSRQRSGQVFDIIRVPANAAHVEMGCATYTTFGAAWLAAQAGVPDTWIETPTSLMIPPYGDDLIARRVADGEWVEVVP